MVYVFLNYLSLSRVLKVPLRSEKVEILRLTWTTHYMKHSVNYIYSTIKITIMSGIWSPSFIIRVVSMFTYP